MRNHTIEWPEPVVLGEQLDSPPSDELLAWLPELVDQHAQVLQARTAADEAYKRFAASVSAVSVHDRHGADWVAAVDADVKAVAAGKPAGRLAALIGEQPQRFGDWHAKAVHADQLVTRWNASAHGSVSSESKKKLSTEESRLYAEAIVAAGKVLEAADEAGPSASDEQRLRSAWQALSELDRIADQWRVVLSVWNWVAPKRDGRGPYWQPVTPDEWPAAEWPSGIGDVDYALAIRDSTLRQQIEAQRQAERVR